MKRARGSLLNSLPVRGQLGPFDAVAGGRQLSAIAGDRQFLLVVTRGAYVAYALPVARTDH